jgi:hypothetical protein
MARQIVSARDLSTARRFPQEHVRLKVAPVYVRLEVGPPQEQDDGDVALGAGDSLAAEVQANAKAKATESTRFSDANPPTSGADGYSDRLIKYIPAEVVALYLTLDALIRSAPEVPSYVYWGVLIFCFVGTYLYLWRIQKVKKQLQLHISGGAFLVWVFAIGGPFAHLGWYNPLYAGLLLPMFTFLVALVEP